MSQHYHTRIEEAQFERTIEAHCAEEAAEQCVRLYEWDRAEYSIGSGEQTAEVLVTDSFGHTELYRVEGITEPVYSAQKID